MNKFVACLRSAVAWLLGPTTPTCDWCGRACADEELRLTGGGGWYSDHACPECYARLWAS